jgi:hypothetical protein
MYCLRLQKQLQFLIHFPSPIYLACFVEKYLLSKIDFDQGAKYLTGENLKVDWAKFSTLSLAILFHKSTNAFNA